MVRRRVPYAVDPIDDRGGAFDQPAAEARSANRAGAEPTRRHFGLGLRPVRAAALTRYS